MLLLTGLIWEAVAGPFPRMEPACYVFMIGFLAVVAGLLIELWVVIDARQA